MSKSSEERKLEFGKSGSGWSLNDPTLKSEIGKMSSFDQGSNTQRQNSKKVDLNQPLDVIDESKENEAILS